MIYKHLSYFSYSIWPYYRAVLNLFSKNMNTAVNNFQACRQSNHSFRFILDSIQKFYVTGKTCVVLVDSEICMLQSITQFLVLLQLVLDSHRWVPFPAVGFPTGRVGEDTQEDVTPPSYLMEHPPLAVFVNGKFSFWFSSYFFFSSDLMIYLLFLQML